MPDPPAPALARRAAPPLNQHASPKRQAPPAGPQDVGAAPAPNGSRLLAPTPNGRVVPRRDMVTSSRPPAAPPAQAKTVPPAEVQPRGGDLPKAAARAIHVRRRPEPLLSPATADRTTRPTAATPGLAPPVVVPTGRTTEEPGPRPPHPATASGPVSVPSVAAEVSSTGGWRVDGITARERAVRFRIKPPANLPIAVRMAEHAGRTEVTLTVPTVSWQHPLVQDRHLLAVRLEAVQVPHPEVSVALAGRSGSGAGDHPPPSPAPGRQPGPGGPRAGPDPYGAEPASGGLNLLA